MIYDVIIVGGGASGLFSGALLSGLKTLILEKENKVGKKLLLTGAGQCNITNRMDIKKFYENYYEAKNFVKPILNSFTNEDLINFFENKGLKLITRDDGKVFPKSMNAKDVVDLLLEEIKQNKGEIKLNQRVNGIENQYIDKDFNIVAEEEYENKEDYPHMDIKKIFKIYTNNNSYMAKNIIISVGGNSYQNTGSSGDGYKILKKLDLDIVDIKPALSPIILKNYEFKDLSGLSFENAKISIYQNEKKQNEFCGDLLFTHKGLSGPVIINNSRYFDSNMEIRINFLGINENDFRQDFIMKLKDNPKKLIKNILKEYDLSTRFVDKIINSLNLFDTTASNLKKEERTKLIHNIVNNSQIINCVQGYHLAMVTYGGLNKKEVNKKTLECKNISNLYVIGETLDIDAKTGGFNLQFAFSSAYCAVKNIKENIIKKV